jgi:hypothetical protein
MGTHWGFGGNMLGTKEKWKKFLPLTKLPISSPPFAWMISSLFFSFGKKDQKEHESIPFLPKYGQQDSKMK